MNIFFFSQASNFLLNIRHTSQRLNERHGTKTYIFLTYIFLDVNDNGVIVEKDHFKQMSWSHINTTLIFLKHLNGLYFLGKV